MISKFNTPSFSGSAPIKSGGKSNGLYWLLGGLLVGYVVYRFVIKPEIDKNKNYVTIKEQE